jgi:hypothetical protein
MEFDSVFIGFVFHACTHIAQVGIIAVRILAVSGNAAFHTRQIADILVACRIEKLLNLIASSRSRHGIHVTVFACFGQQYFGVQTACCQTFIQFRNQLFDFAVLPRTAFLTRVNASNFNEF